MKVRNKVKIHITENKIPAYFYTFSDDDIKDEHIIIIIEGESGGNEFPPLLRIHSECLTGDVFFSSRCDCGLQLRESIERMKYEGGIIAYLRQEGRGIGLYNKIDAYKLQDTGLNTFEANVELGFSADDRKFSFVGKMLKAINVESVRLITNNPLKATALEDEGIDIQSISSTKYYDTGYNEKYLDAKVNIHGHIFGEICKI
ncbi:GTP cyclohydrolase II RibA [Aeromonas sobria]|uniref:GTP cyclohydrolase II RibA n=1 Tax=Aeromonas sobria TaxID=646 RepID=UPI000C6EB1CB|nr:GTP cyclohydrolase II RibA [Aeromonas sobria]PKQ71373.1 hypothetical protein CJF47_20700 [Aeromonas sobria]